MVHTQGGLSLLYEKTSANSVRMALSSACSSEGSASIPGAISAEQVSQQIILTCPVNNVEVLLLQLQTPAKKLWVVIGHSLEKHNDLIVSVDGDYSSAKIYAKVANGECLFLYSGVTFLMGIHLLVVEANKMFQPTNRLKQSGADGQVRGVHVQAEWKRVVWRKKHWLCSQKRLEIKECIISLLGPHKTATFIQQIGKN